MINPITEVYVLDKNKVGGTRRLVTNTDLWVLVPDELNERLWGKGPGICV
jgi:hypothetical protein